MNHQNEPTIDALIEYLESPDADHDLETCQNAEDVLTMVLSIIDQWRLATQRQETTCDTNA